MGRDQRVVGLANREAMFQPTRPHGARRRMSSRTRATNGFNPRARMGRDIDDPSSLVIYSEFQPTRPHGARQTAFILALIPIAFQPTRPHGARQWVAQTTSHSKQFQPTRPHGARLRVMALPDTIERFQPTRPHGARLTISEATSTSESFNPRARMGRDAGHRQAQQAGDVSTHAPAWGATMGSADDIPF